MCATMRTMIKIKKKHILIIDDSVDNQQLLKILLELRGYTTECCSNGEEALQLLKTATRLPNTILLDLRMPVMDGLAFRAMQSLDPRLKKIPVIFISADEGIDLNKAETSDVLQKPLNISQLVKTIEANILRH